MSANPIVQYIGYSAFLPPKPPGGVIYTFLDPASGVLKQINDQGVVTPWGGGAAVPGAGIVKSTGSALATAARADVMTALQPFFLPISGADLGDASVTIDPFVDGAALYVMPAGTATQARTITFNSNASTVARTTASVVIYPQSFAITIQNNAPLLIYTAAVSAKIIRYDAFFFSGSWGPDHITLVRDQ